MLFEQARDDGFSREETNELWNRTGAAVALGAPSPHGAAGTTAGASPLGVAGVSIKTIAALVVGGGLVVAGGIAQLRTASRDVKSVPAMVTAPVQASPPESPPPVIDQPAASAPAVAVANLAAVTDPPHAPPKARAPSGAEGREVPRWAPAQRPVETGDPTSASAPERTTASGGLSALAPSTGSVRQDGEGLAAVPTSGAAPSEGALLLQARRQLASDPAGALALTMEDARRFPAGALAPEREVLAIEALARLGRTSEARQRLDAFKQRFPQSPHVARLDGLIARQER